MKTQFTKLLFLFISILYAQKNTAQNTLLQAQDSIPKSRFTLMVRQPLTWFTKPSIYLGFKTKDLTIFLSASYYNSFICTGPQVALELQPNMIKWRKHEQFFYYRFTAGQFAPEQNYNWENYFSVSVGKGWNVYLGKKMKYFFQPTIGLTLGRLNSGNIDNKIAFYLGGPGTPLDVKLRFGRRIFTR